MSDDREEKERRGFKVEDRRAFNPDGSSKNDTGTADGEKAKECECEDQISKLPEIDFATFVLSLSSSVLMYLGEIPHPESGEKRVDLAVAKQTIDILGILQDKTRGNLEMEEDRLLRELLYDLRMKYVTVCKAS